MLGVDAQVKLFMYKSSYDFYPGMPQNIKKNVKIFIVLSYMF